MKVVLKTRREAIDPSAGQSFRLLKWSGRLHESRVIHADGSTRAIEGEGARWHHHLEMELTLFTTGSGTRFVGDHIGAFGDGDLVLLGKNLPHYWDCPGSSSGLSIQWHFPEGHPLWSFPEMRAMEEVFTRSERGLRLEGTMGERVAEGMRRMAATGGAARLAGLLELFAHLEAGSRQEAGVLSSRSFGDTADSRHQAAIGRAVRHVVTHFRDEVKVADLLPLTGMSRPTFARQFKQHAGRTLSEFVNELRIQAACKRLAATDDSVLEIAMDCGFGQISFFNRLFRREKGCTPREYRGRGRPMRLGVRKAGA